ncbi:YchF/TatD family DNA exonuclease, partial [Candidatus Peregrinibacteria bacterium]|nr:YchF/TatD family DNA exonuclease [Candidatus Peregrinibacteria bacterium]
MLIDTHCHIQFKPLSNDVEAVIASAEKEDVKKLIVVGCDIKSSKEAIDLAETYENVFAAVGLHPQDSKKLTDEMWNELKELAQHEKVVAIGETGLDYFKEYSPKETQIRVFKKHIKLAIEIDKPLIVHNRDADESSLHILQELGAKNVVFHCYSSDVSFARKVWMAGYMTSFTGNVTYPKAQNLRDVIEECPLDAMMVETDCPYLAPQKYRGGT